MSQFRWLRFIDDPIYRRKPDLIDPHLLGGKGATLVRMVLEGLRVPHGFTIYSSAWNYMFEKYQGRMPSDLWQEIQEAMKILGQKTGKIFPSFLVSLRSGALISMPGLMNSLLNIGLTENNFQQYAKQVGLRCTLDSYVRLLRMYATSVYRLSHDMFYDKEISRLETTALEKLRSEFLMTIQKERGTPFETDPKIQLKNGIISVFHSFYNKGAIEYRNANGISHDIGTALTVQEIVHGNLGTDSGTAVIFSRDRLVGTRIITGNFCTNAQGEEVVSGATITQPIEKLPKYLSTELRVSVKKLEKIFRATVDVEVTWSKGTLYYLQVRKAAMSPFAVIKSTIDLMKEKIISKDEALERITLDQILSVRQPRFDRKKEQKARKTKLLFKGFPLHTGVGTGNVYFDAKEALEAVRKGRQVVLLCDHFDPNNIELINGVRKKDGTIHRLQAIITSMGSPSSHMGLIMSSSRPAMPGVMGCPSIKHIKSVGLDRQEINIEQYSISKQTVLKKGTLISVDSSTGEVFKGSLSYEHALSLSPNISLFIKEWEQYFGVNNYWSHMLYPLPTSTLRYDTRVKDYKKLLNQIRIWHSTKAQQVLFMNAVIPPEMGIYTQVVKPHDAAEISSLVAQAKKEKHGIWPRSAYVPDYLKAPYVSTDLTEVSQKELNTWLTGNNSSLSGWGSLDQWSSVMNEEGGMHDLEAVLLPFDPADKLNPAKKHEHFVFSLQANPYNVTVDINIGVIHLRTLEQATQNQLIRIIVVPNRHHPYRLGRLNVFFGLDYFDRKKVEHFYTMCHTTTSHKKVEKLKQKIEEYTGASCDLIEKKDFLTILFELSTQYLLEDHELQLFIDDRALHICSYIKKNLFETWWSQYAIPHLMWALRQTTGASVLEFQGRYGASEKYRWIKVYGTKGEEETSLVKIGAS